MRIRARGLVLATFVNLSFCPLNDSSAGSLAHKEHAERITYLFYISADAPMLYSEHPFYENVLQAFDIRQNPFAASTNAVILYDPYDTDFGVQSHVFSAGIEIKHHLDFNVDQLDMGNAETFSKFLETPKKMGLRSNKTILVLSGHGNSWMGFGADTQGDTLGVDGADPPSFLTLEEMRAAFELTIQPGPSESRWDAIVLNGCIMGSTEVIFELQPYFEYTFASSAPIHLSGSDFPILGSIEEILSYPFLDYNINFNFLHEREYTEVQAILKNLVHSRVIYEFETDTEKGPTANPERIQAGRVEVANANYFYVHNDRWVELVKSTLPQIGPVLVTNAKRANDIFDASKIAFLSHPSIVDTFVDLKALVTALGHMDPNFSDWENIVASIRPAVQTYDDSQVSFPSIYFPHSKVRHYVSKPGELEESDGKDHVRREYDAHLKKQFELRLHQQTEWQKILTQMWQAQDRVVSNELNCREDCECCVPY